MSASVSSTPIESSFLRIGGRTDIADLKLYRDHDAKIDTIRAYLPRKRDHKTNEDFVHYIKMHESLNKKLYGLLLWSRCRRVGCVITTASYDADGLETKATHRTDSFPVPDMKQFPTFPTAIINKGLELARSHVDNSEAKIVSFGFALISVNPKAKDVSSE